MIPNVTAGFAGTHILYELPESFGNLMPTLRSIIFKIKLWVQCFPNRVKSFEEAITRCLPTIPN